VHGCSSLVFVVCCVVNVIGDELIIPSDESYRVCVCDVKPGMRQPEIVGSNPTGGMDICLL
jgi:hypothetical protein